MQHHRQVLLEPILPGHGGIVEAGPGEVVAGGVKGVAGGDAHEVLDGDGGLPGVELAVGAYVHMGADVDLAVQDGEIVDEHMVADGYLVRGIDAAGAAYEHLAAQGLEADLLELPIGVIGVQLCHVTCPLSGRRCLWPASSSPPGRSGGR